MTEPLFPPFQIPLVYREPIGAGEGVHTTTEDDGGNVGHEHGVFVHVGHEHGVFVHPVAKYSLVSLEEDPVELELPDFDPLDDDPLEDPLDDDPVELELSELDPLEDDDNRPLVYKTYTSRPMATNTPIKILESIFICLFIIRV